MHRIRAIHLLVFLTALIVLIVPILLLEQAVLKHTGGDIVFPLDNAFVDITVARNFAFYKVWGISNSIFQPVSSSPLYSLVLTPVFFVAGEHLIIPVLVNGLLAALLLYLVQRMLIRRQQKPSVQLAVLLAIVLFGALPLLAFSGMGYILQGLTCFLFVEEWTRSAEIVPAKLPTRVYGYGILMIAAGSESMLVLLFACTLLHLMRRTRQAIKLGLLSLTPLVLFSVICLLKKMPLFPSALRPALYPLPAEILTLAIIVMGGVLVWRWRLLPASPGPVSVYRLSLGWLCLLALPFMVRNVWVLRHFKRDCLSMYDEGYRLAGFIHRYYKTSPVGVNDIGAVAWFSDGMKLDFTGLTSEDVAEIKNAHSWTPQWADSLSRKNYVSTLMVSDPWFQPELLPDWDRVASWKFPDSPFHSGKTVSFYVRYQRDTVRLLRFLRDYQKGFSREVDVRYY